jgi:hypothetical protein
MDKLKNLTTLRYWISVIGLPTIKAAIPISDVRDRVVHVLISLIVAFIFVGVYGQVIDQSFEIGFNPITFVYLLLATFGLRLITGLIYLPAKLYSDQGGFVENPFQITTVNPNLNFSEPDERWASVKVSNQSVIANIEACFLELNGIVDLQTNQTIPFEPQRLRWSGREGADNRTQPIIVYPDSPRWCDIAHATTKDDSAYYTTWFGQGREQTRIREGKYRLKIKVHGEWKGHQISYPYSLDLIYQPDNKRDTLVIRRIEQIE